MYVIKRTDQGGGYLAAPGSNNAYTNKLEKARRFSTYEKADGERCKGNEVVVPLGTILEPYRGT